MPACQRDKKTVLQYGNYDKIHLDLLCNFGIKTENH